MRAEFIDNNYMVIEHNGWKVTVTFSGPITQPHAAHVNIRHDDGTVLRNWYDNGHVRVPEVEIEAINTRLVL